MNQTFEDFTLYHRDIERSVPVRRYNADGEPVGWLLFSVGFGGDRNGYGFLAREWASFGLTTFVIEHVGSNMEVLRSLPQRRREERNAEVVRRVGDPAELRARPRDVELVWRHFRGEFDEVPLGIGGHSYGSYTALACAGMVPRVVEHEAERLPARGLLVISPQPPGLLFAPGEYQKVEAPVLVMTGTKDHLLSGGSDYSERLEAFKLLPAGQKHCLVLKDFEHMDFAGVGLGLADKIRVLQATSRTWWSHSLLSPVADLPAALKLAAGAEGVEFCS